MLHEMTHEVAYVTPKGLAKIEKELDYLQRVKLAEVAERLHDTRAGGDLVDNIEYMAAEDDMAFVKGRIANLQAILRHAEIIQPGAVDGIIRLGSTVMVQEKDADLETYILVGPAEADPTEGLISNLSPLGRALINHTIGDDVEVAAPDGQLRFRICAVL